MRRVLVGLALAVSGLTLTACPEPPEEVRVPITQLAPAVEDFQVDPRESATRKTPFTLVIAASDPNGKKLTYAWTANKGQLSKATGTKVEWTPVNPNGSAADGYAQVHVIVSNGEYQNEAYANFLIADDGATQWLPPGSVPTTVTRPTPQPSGSATASDACAVDDVLTTLVAPGSALLVGGRGLDGEASVQVGDTAASVIDVAPGRMTALLPASVPVQNQALAVKVTACGETTTAASTIVVADLGDFGGAVKTAGAGLLASLYALPQDTEALPADWGKLDVRGRFLARAIDVAPQAFLHGFATSEGDLSEWYALRYTGSLTVEEAGSYGFSLLADDGAKLYLDGKLVVDDDGVHAAEQADGTAELSAGKHDFRLEYFHGAGYQVALQLYWTPPGGREAIVPASALKPE